MQYLPFQVLWWFFLFPHHDYKILKISNTVITVRCVTNVLSLNGLEFRVTSNVFTGA